MKGYIIVIEGTDGSGKQTQTALLYDKLLAKGKDVIKKSFPNYESLSSGPVKMYLNGELGKNANDMDAYQASVLFAVDRLCTFQKLKEHYDHGGIIIFDRYVQSNMLHQAGKIQNLHERDTFLEWLDDLEFNHFKLPRPDKIIFLDMPVEMSRKLAEQRGALKAGTAKDIHEQDEQHLIQAYQAGKYVAKKFGWNTIACLDQHNKLKSIEEINEEIVADCFQSSKKIHTNFLPEELSF